VPPAVLATEPPASAPAGRAPRPFWAWARLLGGVGILALLVWQVGTGPFLAGVRMVNGPALALAFAIGVVTTVCCAWRWCLVASGLGVRLPLGEAVAAYYRSQFLNTTLPGGVIGDVSRGTPRPGHRRRQAGRARGGARTAGRPDRAGRHRGRRPALSRRPYGGICRSWFCRRRPGYWRDGDDPGASAGLLTPVGAGIQRVGSDIRDGVFAQRNWMGVVLASAVVVTGAWPRSCWRRGRPVRPRPWWCSYR
jgi:hypothetical protein